MSTAPERTGAAARLVLARRASNPRFKREADLPLAARREEILALLRERQVLIVAGETGSGKSTQLPQYCLEAGRGIDGMIAHTQPRRLAARALAARIALEVSEPVGATVGFRVRFADRVADGTRLVLMTDGMLLAELGSDPSLGRYDTVIVDEAHERSLNVDLLFGVLKRLLAVRADLKVIITSATLDVERIARFFDDAPVVTAGGRGHPIELRYAEPAPDGEEPDLPAAVLQAYRAIEADPGPAGRGDVLVFLPGEREIADTGELLERELADSVEIVPLYSRLAWERQSRIFERGRRRRVVLATNVAETSVTVPGIRAVIDSGLARISRYSARSRLQRLPIEPISRASADQRMGRCGRIGPGLCVRLYGSEDYEARPAFTEPEILRTNLAALLLRLAADGLGEAETFPFIDAPDGRALNDGYRLLQELSAIDAERRITAHGRRMARLPLDPRLGRALLESRRYGAEEELLIIASGLSVPDARLRDAPPPADAKSEFVEMVRLWRGYRGARAAGRRDLRRWCVEQGLSLQRLCEWDNVHAQLTERAQQLGLRPGVRRASYTAIHRSLLAGFCTMTGTRAEEGVYHGTRGLRFRLFPGSPLARRKPRWIVAANIVETSRVYARGIAEIDPSWIESAAAHLVKREYLEPDWDEAREEVVARERTSLLGLPLGGRRVNYGPIAPEEARRIFAREALVHERLTRRPAWLLANDAAIAAARRVEERLRVRDLVADTESFVEFYERALPRQVSSAATLEHFTRRQDEAAALGLGAADIFVRAPDAEALRAFPERVVLGSLIIDVTYRFDPADPRDGATLVVPAIALPALTRADIDAAIPGFARPRVEALLRSLPKEVRRRLIPIAATAERFVAGAGPAGANRAALAHWLRAEAGVAENLIRFAAAELPAHLEPRVEVRDGDAGLSRGADLAAQRCANAAAARAALDRAGAALHPEPWRRFELEELPAATTISIPQGTLTVFTALERGAEGFAVRLHWSAAEAEHRHRAGLAALAALGLAREQRGFRKRLLDDTQLLLAASPWIGGDALVDGLLGIALRRACFGEPGAGAPRRRADFDSALARGRPLLHPAVETVRAEAWAWFAALRGLRLQLDRSGRGALAESARETDAHVRRLVRAALDEADDPWLGQVPRYLRAEEKRWQRLAARGTEPPAIIAGLRAQAAGLAALAARVAAEHRWLPQLEELRWWIEEHRVSLYAQELRTAVPVSAARLAQRAAEIDSWLKR